MPTQISKTRVWGEVEKDSFTALPVKGGHSRLMPLKNCVPNPEGLGKEFFSNGLRTELLIKIRVCAGPTLL